MFIGVQYKSSHQRMNHDNYTVDNLLTPCGNVNPYSIYMCHIQHHLARLCRKVISCFWSGRPPYKSCWDIG